MTRPSEVYGPRQSEVYIYLKEIGYQPVDFRPPIYRDWYLRPGLGNLRVLRRGPDAWFGSEVLILKQVERG